MIDLLDYLRGDGRLYELVNNLGSAEVAQTHTEPNNVFFHVKNSQWEELWADDVFIYRGTDTSPGNGEIYILSENNHYGSAWVPRYFDVGQVFRRSTNVIWRRKDNGQSVPSKPTANAVTYLRCERVYSQLTFQSGIQLQDVVELHALLDNGGKPAASPWEKYFYARGFGLVAFQDMLGGFTSWIAQKFTPEIMPQRVRESIGWLVPLQKRYYLPPAPQTTVSGQFIASQMNAAWTNVRSYPNDFGKDIGDLNKGDVVTVFTPETSDGWVMIQKPGLTGWSARKAAGVVFTATDGTPTPDPTPLPTVKPMGSYALTQLPSNWVNVRDYPNTNGNDVGDLHKNDVVTLYTPDVDGWVFIDDGSVQGWVSRQNGSVVFTATSTTPTPIPPVDLPPLPTIKPAGTFTLTKMPSTWVNVRAYPDLVGADVGDFHKGDSLTLYTPEVNGWVFAESGTVRGWVSRQNGNVDFTPLNGNAPLPHDDLPELPTTTPSGLFTLTKIPSKYINVRAYPNDQGADVGDLHLGDLVQLYTPEVEGWVQVQNETVRGWISRQNGKVDFSQATAQQVMINASASAVESEVSRNAIVPVNSYGNGSAAPEPMADGQFSSKDDALRMREAFLHVEEGARKVRTELERLIGRMK